VLYFNTTSALSQVKLVVCVVAISACLGGRKMLTICSAYVNIIWRDQERSSNILRWGCEMRPRRLLAVILSLGIFLIVLRLRRSRARQQETRE